LRTTATKVKIKPKAHPLNKYARGKAKIPDPIAALVMLPTAKNNCLIRVVGVYGDESPRMPNMFRVGDINRFSMALIDRTCLARSMGLMEFNRSHRSSKSVAVVGENALLSVGLRSGVERVDIL
jgi:hypothetical protein